MRLLLDENWSWRDFEDEEQKVLAKVSTAKCTCSGASPWAHDSPPFVANLRRLNVNKVPNLVGESGFLARNFNVYLFIADNQERTYLLDEWKRRKKKGEAFCQCRMRSYFKSVTGLFKRGAEYIHPFWRLMCYWETFFGFHPYIGLDKMYDKARDWLHDEKTVGNKLPPGCYASMIYEKCRHIIRNGWKSPRKIWTLQEWVETGEWMQGKAGTGGKLSIEVDGRRKRSRGMKAVEGALKSDEQVVAEMCIPHPEVMIVMEKSESGKSRPVVKCSNESNRLMGFLSQWAEDGLAGVRESTLFMSGDMHEEYDIEMLRKMEDGNSYKVPLDQGSFDNMQTKETIQAVFLALRDEIYDITHNREFLFLFNTLLQSIFVMTPTVIVGNRSFPWRNGVPSGWRWTALLDTLLNLSSFKVILDLIELRYSKRADVADLVAQGDDILFTCRSLELAEQIISMYRWVGYDVHPEKTFVSRHRAEFLRRSYERGKLIGYRARGMLSILYRNPIKEPEMVKPMRIYSRVSVWNMMVLRGACAERVVDLMMEDARQAGIDEDKAAGFVLLPAAYGGAGVVPDSRLGGQLKRYWKGKYWRPQWVYGERRLSVNIGKWSSRLAKHHIRLGGSNYDAFTKALLHSWGYTDKTLYTSVDVTWEEVFPAPALRIFHLNGPVPSPEGLWKETTVPKQLLPYFKRQLIEEGREGEMVKEEARDWLAAYRRRVSVAVYRAYLLGEISLPTPSTETLAARYGASVKRRCNFLIRLLLNTKNLSLTTLQRGLHAVENLYITATQTKYEDMVLAQ